MTDLWFILSIVALVALVGTILFFVELDHD